LTPELSPLEEWVGLLKALSEDLGTLELYSYAKNGLNPQFF